MQQGSSAGTTATLTDEQILGLDDGLEAVSVTGGAAAGQGAAPDPFTSLHDDAQDPHTQQRRVGHPQLNEGESAARERGAQSGDAATAIGPGETEPAWLATLEAQPGAAAEAREWHAAARDISSIDAAYFSAEPGARAGLAERLYQSDPAAFRAMLVDSARMLASRDPQGLAEMARQLNMPDAARPLRPRSISQVARGDGGTTEPPDSISQPQVQQTNSGAQTDSHPTQATNSGFHGRSQSPAEASISSGGTQFPSEAYRAFEATTNEDVGRRMHEAIDRTLSWTLPEGVGEGARRRIGEDIFREVHASLSSDRDLSRRVGETLRDWRFDASAREQVVSLLTGRARAVLPEVARRVVSEWTSSVLASDRARTARIDAAAARRDITGGRLPEPVSSSALHPREVDYRRLSDEQILGM